MKKIYVNEEWCLGCHLCEYYCAFANSGIDDMVKALKDVKINPKIRVEGNNQISFAVSCRHCEDPACVKSCITGAMYIEDGTIRINKDKCVGCYTCILSCPYGSIMPSNEGVVQKCELCMDNSSGAPACVAGCPNKAIVYKEG
ncbi:MAG: 4Fe-4S dicluster domain-containing protein [Clostridia bacterium]|nr:4Fe-4S dicluster domain-containing protein [Clostridia bacterium]